MLPQARQFPNGISTKPAHLFKLVLRLFQCRYESNKLETPLNKPIKRKDPMKYRVDFY